MRPSEVYGHGLDRTHKGEVAVSRRSNFYCRQLLGGSIGARGSSIVFVTRLSYKDVLAAKHYVSGVSYLFKYRHIFSTVITYAVTVFVYSTEGQKGRR